MAHTPKVLFRGLVGVTDSPGITWSAATMPRSTTWGSVAYGNGTFVAVSTFGTAATSTDGVTWAENTLPGGLGYGAVTFGNGTFVALPSSASTSVATSSNGINWTLNTIGSNLWNAVAYGNGMFLAVGNATNNCATSPDGVNWTTRAMTGLPSQNWLGVTFGDGKFVATGNSTSGGMTHDGITWTAATLPTGTAWYGVTYGNGTFVAVLAGGSTAGTSTNGTSWSVQNIASGTWRGLTYVNGMFVTTSADSSSKVATSLNGAIWTVRSLPVAGNYYALTSGGGAVVAISGSDVATSPAHGTVLYTVPPATTAVITDLHVENSAAGAVTASLALDRVFALFGTSMAATSSVDLSVRQVLPAGATISGFGTGQLTVLVNGVEIT